MERQNGFAAWQEAAEQTQRQQTRCQVPADVHMDDITRHLANEPQDLERTVRVEDVVRRRLTMTCQVDNRAGNLSSQEKAVDRHQIGLHTTVRGRIGAEK